MSHSPYRSDPPRPPTVEPEILPPEPASAREAYGWTAHRVFIVRPSPWARALALIGVVGLVGTILALALGLFLLALPIAAAVAAAYALGRSGRARSPAPPPARQ